MIKEKIVLTDAQTKWLQKHFKHTKMMLFVSVWD